MEEKNIKTLIKTLVEKIIDLEVELNLTKYERDALGKEIKKRKNDVKFHEDELTPKEDMGNA